MRTLICLLILLIISAGSSFAETQRGAVLSAAYYHLGYGTLNIPYDDGPAGTAATRPESGSSLISARKYSISVGYFYGIFQTDVNFSRAVISSQIFDENNIQNTRTIDAETDFFNLRAGRRFYTPGDLSYHWIYLGLRHMNFNSSYEDIDSSGTGYFVGYEGFYSYGLKSSIEFVLKCSLNVGTYRKADLSSSQEFSSTEKNNSITAGVDIGAGIQYEPQNLTFLLKGGYDFNYIEYTTKYNSSDINIGCAMTGYYLGFEIVYMIPNHKFNKNK